MGDLQPGDTLAGYRIERLLGRGGMAAVYLAEDDRLRRKVALKVLSPDLALDETFRQRFVGESERLASVDHPNIIPVYEAGEHGSVLFIAMRYVETIDLKHLIAQEGGLDPERAVTIVAQVAAALDAAHAKGMVHRDVKPANVLVATGAGAEGHDHAYLSDFGLTKRTKETSGLTRTGYFMGTIDYVAPEQISGKGIDGRTDQYALACVLFESLAARPPFAREDEGAVIYAHLSEPPPSLSAVRRDLDPAIDAVIATGMAKDKDDRYPYCVAFARAARGALLGQRAVTPPTGITSGEAEIAEAIEERQEQAPVSPPVGVPAPPPPPPEPSGAGTAPVPTAIPTTQPTPVPPGGSKRALVLVAVVAALLLAAGGVALLAAGGDEQDSVDPTGTVTGPGTETGVTGATAPTGATGATGATAPTGATAAPSPPPLAEARVFGDYAMTFNPQDDPSAGAAVSQTWVLKANCDARSGPHPCDVDALSPMSGFVQRTGKTYVGTVSGDFLCGPSQMELSFEVTDAASVEGPWRATEVRGTGTMLSGGCPGSIFVLVGVLA